MAQSAPQLLSTTVLGRLADVGSPSLLVGACGVALTVVALLALRSTALWELRTNPAPTRTPEASAPLED